MYIGIVTKDRYSCLNVLLKSLKDVMPYVTVVDASDNFNFTAVKDIAQNCKKYIRNSFRHYKSVNHNKNIIIHDFKRSKCQHLFILEDDVKVLDTNVFAQYIKVSTMYNIPHMNAGGPPSKDKIIYQANKYVQVSDTLCGFFSFFTRQCIEYVGLMNKDLDGNCWEHVEHTARIHNAFNFQPVFHHFPDIKNSWHQILCQQTDSVISVDKEHRNKYLQIMMQSLNWKNFPPISIKRLQLHV